MPEFRIQWAICPTACSQTRIMFVDAETRDAAEAVAKDHIERKHGIGWYKIFSVEPYTRPTSGHVISG